MYWIFFWVLVGVLALLVPAGFVLLYCIYARQQELRARNPQPELFEGDPFDEPAEPPVFPEKKKEKPGRLSDMDRYSGTVATTLQPDDLLNAILEGEQLPKAPSHIDPE